MNSLAENCKKFLISQKSTKNSRCDQNFATFRGNYHILEFPWSFQQEVAKSGSFREKARKIIDLANNMQLFEQTTMFLHLDELLRKRLEKVLHFVKKHEKSSIWSKLASFRKNYQVLTFRWSFQQEVAKSASFRDKARKIIDLAKTLQLFEQSTMFLHLDELLRKRLEKVPHFVKKHEKSSIWPKLCNFSNKLPCFCIWMNSLAEKCKKCLISQKSTKNSRCDQNFATFWTNYHVFAFGWTFKEKVGKSASFREKERKIIDLAKTCKFFEQTTMFLHFDELLRKRLEKVPHFVKKHEKSSIWPKLVTSRRNYHVFLFRWLLQEKVATRWKKWLISWKMTKNHRFGLNLQLFSKKWVISWKMTKNRHSEVA